MNLLAKLDSYIDKSGECWLWLGGKDPEGYGICRSGLPTRKVHRVMWILTYGPIENGMCICHKCDNPSCCNPEHLFCGTHADNTADCIRKGRRNPAKGAATGHAKLAPDEVKEIRLLRGDLTVYELARRYSVSPATISTIHNRKVWKHIP